MKLTKRQRELLKIINDDPGINAERVALLMNTTYSAINKVVSGLTKYDLAYYRGNGGSREFWITDAGMEFNSNVSKKKKETTVHKEES